MSCFPQALRRWTTIIRDFASAGQLLDLSVALVIGNTFTRVMESMVDDLLTPVLGYLFDGTNIGDLRTQLQSSRWPHKTPVTVPYGRFLQRLIYFAIIAIALSVLVLLVSKVFRRQRENQVNAELAPSRQELIAIEHTRLLQAIEQSLRK